MPRDGNPLVEVSSSNIRRRIQVIQWPPESDEMELGAWVSQREHWEADKKVVWDELTLNLSLSQESAAAAEELVRSWMDPSTTREEMEAIIREKGTS